MLLNTIFGVKKISSNGKEAKYEVIDISHKRQTIILFYLVQKTYKACLAWGNYVSMYFRPQERNIT